MHAIYSILDIPKGMRAIVRRCQDIHPSGAFFLFICLFILFWPLAYLFWTYDLLSTWNWTSFVGIREVDTQPFRDQATTALDINDPGMLLSMVIWSFALLPTLVEVAFPHLVDKATSALAIFLKGCIAFDMVTDVPSVWNIIHKGALQADGTRGDAWFASWGIAQYLPQALCTVVFGFIVSVVLQVIIVYIVTALVVLAWNILAAGARGSLDDVKVLTGDGHEVSVRKRLHS